MDGWSSELGNSYFEALGLLLSEEESVEVQAPVPELRMGACVGCHGLANQDAPSDNRSEIAGEGQ